MNMQRAIVMYEFALREAVREKRPMTWVSGLPRLWGSTAVVEHRLWGDAADCRTCL